MAVAENPGNWNCPDLVPALVLVRGQVVPAVQAGVQEAAYPMDKAALDAPLVNIHTGVIVSSLVLKTDAVTTTAVL